MTKEESAILEKAAQLFTNSGDDSTPEERRNALREEIRLLEELAEINPQLAETCGLRIERQMLNDTYEEDSNK